MKAQYKIIFVIATLLLLLSFGMSVTNYFISLQNAQKQLQDSSLPLSTDNIYSHIQKHLIEPNIVASMMAQDTFLKDWLMHGEENEKNIQKYLESIKNKYQMHTVFLASEDTKHYYSAKGFVEKMNPSNTTNSWYYALSEKPVSHEINIDFNEHVDNSMIMFINHKIFDEEYRFLGATGVGLKLEYIDDMLKLFRQKYKFIVSFIDKNGMIIMQEKVQNNTQHLKENLALYKHKDLIFMNDKQTLHYEKDGKNYLAHSKFIPELNVYLLVEAKMNDFTSDVIQTLYINLLLSLLTTFIIIFIILKMIQNHSKKLEDIANYDALTKIFSRRIMNEKIMEQLLQNKRKPVQVSILFCDIDDFKNVNDTLGHDIGDKVLVRFAEILKSSVRETDYVARWGGEEFMVLLIESSLNDSQKSAQKLRVTIQEDKVLHSLVHYNLTASFGLTQMYEEDTIENLLKRVDDALYEAKRTGKNKVVLAPKV